MFCLRDAVFVEVSIVYTCVLEQYKCVVWLFTRKRFNVDGFKYCVCGFITRMSYGASCVLQKKKSVDKPDKKAPKFFEIKEGDSLKDLTSKPIKHKKTKYVIAFIFR